MRTVVVGGGVIGLSCAWRLAAKGHRVTLLDSRQCGHGASLAALGALWPASARNGSPAATAQRQALLGYEQFLDELRAASGLPISYRRLGRIEIMTSAEDAQRGREQVEAANTHWGEGQCMHFLDAPHFQNIPTPFGAVHCRITAHVRVPELVAALRAACERAKVLIHENTPLRRLERINNEWLANDIPADTVVITAGAWSSALLPANTSTLTVKPVKGQALALAFPPGLTLPCILKKGPTYLVPWPEHHEILVGSTTEHAGFDEAPTAAARDVLHAGAIDLCPALAGTRILRHWTGLRPKSKPAPLVSEVAPHAWLCTGHYKTGIAMCGDAGRHLADLISKSPPAS